MSNNQSRRKFIKNSATAAAAVSIPSIIPARAFGANDRIIASVQGLNGRGKSHVKSLMNMDNVEIKTLCDPDMNILKKRQAEYKKE